MNRIEHFESEEREALLTAYALGELTKEERGEVEGWLAQSPAAVERLEEIRRLNAALLESRQAAQLSPPSASLRLDVLGKLAEMQGAEPVEPVSTSSSEVISPSVSPTPRKKDMTSFVLRLAALAAALLVTAGLVVALVNAGREDRTRASLAQQLAQFDSLIQAGQYEEAQAVVEAVYREAEEKAVPAETLKTLFAENLSPATIAILVKGQILEEAIPDGSPAALPEMLPESSPGAAQMVEHEGESSSEGSPSESSPAENLVAGVGGEPNGVCGCDGGCAGCDGLMLADNSGSMDSNQLRRLGPQLRYLSGPNGGQANFYHLTGPGTYPGYVSPQSPFAFQGTTSLHSGTTAIDPAEGRLEERIPVVGDFAALPDGFAVEQYDDRVENPWNSPLLAPLSTFSIDVDTASYANVRRFLRDSQLPPTAAVRVEEFINYFDYEYAPPGEGAGAAAIADSSEPVEGEGAEEAAPVEEAGAPVGPVPFAVHMEVAACPWNTEHQLVRIGLRGREVPTDDRPASNLVFLIDVSGSMSGLDKLALVKEGMLLLVNELNENDRVTIVTYAGDAGLRLPPTPGNEKETILAAIESLQPGGSTYGSAGIELAYDKASESFVEGGTNRVIWATDGDLNVGLTSDEALIDMVSGRAEEGVFLTVLGVGRGNLQDAKLEGIADNGNGHYAYLDSLYEAQKVLVHDLSGTLITIAQDVKLQVEFNPEQVAAYRLIGYENRLLATEDFDNDIIDAGEIGAGHTITALYEIIPPEALVDAQSAPADDSQGAALPTLRYQVPGTAPELTEAAASDELLRLALRYKEPTGLVSRRLEYVLETSDTPFGLASEDFRFASAAAAFGMLLRRSEYAGGATFASVEEYAAGTVGESVERREFVELVRQAGLLSFEGLEGADADAGDGEQGEGGAAEGAADGGAGAPANP